MYTNEFNKNFILVREVRPWVSNDIIHLSWFVQTCYLNTNMLQVKVPRVLNT